MIANLITGCRILLLIPLEAVLARGGSGWAALGLLLAAGLTDIVDGRVARALKQASRLGALLDLAADRLLTLTVVLGLAASGRLDGWALACGGMLVARDLLVAGFGEAAPGLELKVTLAEKVKIAAQFGGFALLCAPRLQTGGPLDSWTLGQGLVAVAALLAAATTAGYADRVRRRL